jgi:hypothetical protein
MTTQELLDDRYGRTRRPGRRRAAWVAVIAVAALAVGALAWVTISSTLDDVRADDTGFTVVDEHAVSVSFQVSGPTGREIACALEALDPEFGVVGWKVIVLPPAGEVTRAFTETVPTIARATTGLVNSCWVT